MLLLSAGLLALAGCSTQVSPGPSQTSAATIERGRAIASSQCESCHAIGPLGESAFPEAPPFRTLSEKYPVRDLEEAFAEGAIVGHPAMPAFRFEPDEIDDLLTYLESLQAAPSAF